jgi:hypothetical protein
MMWIALGIVLLVGWLLLKLAWNVASAGVHILLFLAALAGVVHLVRHHLGRHRHGSQTPL